jgi:cysteinyl-tRNA synthetase
MTYAGADGVDGQKEDEAIGRTCQEIRDAMDDDFNTAIALAGLFELSSKVNSLAEGVIPFSAISQSTFDEMKDTFITYTEDILGLKDENAGTTDSAVVDGLMKLIIDIRKTARDNKDFATSDKIRDALKEAGVELQDGKEGTRWNTNG